MSRVRMLFVGAVGVFALCGAVSLWAQETPAVVQDPISPADCLRDKKKAPDCRRLGILYAAGKDVPQDEPRAIEFFDAACRAGLIVSCGAQGWLLLKLHQRPEDAERGARLLDRACKEDVRGACDGLGRAYASGIGVARDVPRAAKLLGKACEWNLVSSCVALAELLNAGDGVARDVERAKALMGKACGLGATEACEKVCDTGDGDACQTLGRQLERAKEPDAGSINRAYRRACDAARAESCYDLGVRTKDKDAEQALPLFERACAVDYAPACLAAGHSYYLGRGAAIDLAAAVRFYAKACEKDMDAACGALGGVYARGELGVDQTAKGEAYLVKACGEDAECRVIVALGKIPKAWGGSLDALRPRDTAERPQGPMRVGGRIQAPKKTRDMPPRYPPMAREARIQGTVTLECVISPRGDVTHVRVINSIPMLDAAAVDAVRQWRYAPTLLDGMPVPVTMTVTVSFRIG